MPDTRVIAIDPAPAKPSTVFDGIRYAHMAAPKLRELLKQIASGGPGTLVCWDAPLTGPSDMARPGSSAGDFTKRPIERFFSLKATGFKAPKGISVHGYGACPHWTISRSLLGLPRVGPFDAPTSELPFSLTTETGSRDRRRPNLVEIHPALAAWLWCRSERAPGASWRYKDTALTARERRGIWQEMWEIILERVAIARDLPRPGTDDEFDAAIGYVLGATLLRDEAEGVRRCAILGNAHDGTFLLPHSDDLAAAWLLPFHR